jgi:DNA-binding CsgD family transcriptional regulator
VLDQWLKSLSTIQNFIEYLKFPDLTEQDICQYLVVNALEEYGVISTFVQYVSEGKTVKVSGRFGADNSKYEDWLDFSIDLKVPVTDALTDNRIVWINNLPNWPEEYIALKNFPIDQSAKTFIAIPFSCIKHPVAVLGLFSRKELDPNSPLESLLQILSNLIGIKLDQDLSAVKNNADYQTKMLSRRQKQILSLILKEYTNHEIADLLGYSTSTIKQEVSKIYHELKVKTREEAIVYLLES